MGGVNCVLSEDHFLCSICLEVFTDPVTTACGHSFCNVCINKHWDNSVHCHCPVCKEEFSTRPQLKTSTFMAEMVSEFKNKPQREDPVTSDSAGAGDVLCDYCPEPKLKALKSCLVCQTSYCPDHLTPHDTVPRLTKHPLIHPVENLEERICPQHDRLIDTFCKEHSQLICVQCSYSEHREHSTVPLKEQCEEELAELLQMIQDRQNKIQELQRSVELSQQNADREIKEGVEFFNNLVRFVQESLDQFKQNITEKHQEIESEGKELIEELESEISALEQRRVQMEEIWSSDDHFDFVQTFTIDKPTPALEDWTEVSVRAPLYEGRVAVALSDLLVEKLNPQIKRLFDDELQQAKKHAVNVTFDPDTAPPRLVVSRDHKQICFTEITQKVRFSHFLCAIGKQKISSGKLYFEVQVKDKTQWWLGMVKESADRRLAADRTIQNGFWRLCLTSNVSPSWPVPHKVGVFVHYEEGLICFFDADLSTLIGSFIDCGFTENILPLFSPGNNEDGNNLAPLIITPVTVEK